MSKVEGSNQNKNDYKSQIESEAQALGTMLVQRRLKMVTAESCTGGLVAVSITDIPGSSSWFEQGYVTYSNESKQSLLGVSKVTLDEKGAVSERVVMEMLSGALGRSACDIGVAISGIAGPGGGSLEKPVGTVWLAWGSCTETNAKKHCFDGDRTQIRQAAVLTALKNVRDFAENNVVTV